MVVTLTGVREKGGAFTNTKSDYQISSKSEIMDQWNTNSTAQYSRVQSREERLLLWCVHTCHTGHGGEANNENWESCHDASVFVLHKGLRQPDSRLRSRRNGVHNSRYKLQPLCASSSWCEQWTGRQDSNSVRRVVAHSLLTILLQHYS